MMLKLKLQYFGHLMQRVDSLGKPLMLGGTGGRRRRGRHRMRWLNDAHEFGWTLGVGDGQGGLACCNSWGRKESDTTERLNWNETISCLKATYNNGHCCPFFIYHHPSTSCFGVSHISISIPLHKMTCLSRFLAIIYFLFLTSVQFSSLAQSYLTLCNPMDCSTPGLPVHHQLPEFTQTHVLWVGDAI